MMELLAEKLQAAMKKIRGYGKLTEDNIAESMKEVRLALLGADVHYQVAREFCDRVKEKALGEEVAASIKPGDLFVKIVHDELLELFGEGSKGLSEERPLKIVLCGLNGSGKTTTAAKLALYLKRQKESVLLVAADMARPAAIDQLETLGKQIGVPVFRPAAGIELIAHIRNAEEEAKKQNARITIYDTAGRLEADEELLKELKEIIAKIQPQECLLVVDAATGQTAVNVAKAFKEAANLTGLILSKFDGDAKGGAALSLKNVAECPIKFLGTGEQVPALEVFQPERLVSRILGMGDIIGLVEKAQEAVDFASAEKMSKKLMENSFDLQDFLGQMQMMKKLGPLQNLLGMVPGMDKLSSSALDEKSFQRTEAIILSMTHQERRKPDLLNARRRLRIAAGSGTTVADVNDLMRRFMMMKKMVSKVSKGGNMEKRLKSLLNQFKP